MQKEGKKDRCSRCPHRFGLRRGRACAHDIKVMIIRLAVALEKPARLRRKLFTPVLTTVYPKVAGLVFLRYSVSNKAISAEA